MHVYKIHMLSPDVCIHSLLSQFDLSIIIIYSCFIDIISSTSNSFFLKLFVTCYSAFLRAFDMSACRIVVLRKNSLQHLFLFPFFQNLFLNNAFLHNLCRVGKFSRKPFLQFIAHIRPALRESFGIRHHQSSAG